MYLTLCASLRDTTVHTHRGAQSTRHAPGTARYGAVHCHRHETGDTALARRRSVPLVALPARSTSRTVRSDGFGPVVIARPTEDATMLDGRRRAHACRHACVRNFIVFSTDPPDARRPYRLEFDTARFALLPATGEPPDPPSGEISVASRPPPRPGSDRLAPPTTNAGPRQTKTQSTWHTLEHTHTCAHFALTSVESTCAP